MAAIKCIFLLTSIASISCRQINFLPFEKVKAYLDDDSSSDYEIVSLVHTLHKRSLPSTMRIRTFQKDIELYLEPNENYLFGNNTPVYLSYRGQDNNYTFKSFSHDKLALYQDVKNKAAIVVEEKGEKHSMYGMIGDYMIHPLDEEKQSSVKHKRSTNSKTILTAKDNEILADDHVLVKINQPKYDIMEEPKKRNRFVRSVRSLNNSNHTKQDRLYPEILVCADYNYFNKSGGNVKEFIKYQVVFWNGVDLLYRYFEKPEIRLNIAGIVISQETSADIYFKTHVRRNQLNFNEFMNTFQSYRSIRDDDFPKISYDIVVALTNYELVDHFTTKDNSFGTYGVAFRKGACVNRASIAIIRDLLAFKGVSSTAHELGHLFGAPHDFDSVCRADVRVADFMMSYDSVSENQLRWSACSWRHMRTFFHSYQARCLRNKPTAITSPYEKSLPGKIADVEAQCQTMLPGSKVYSNGGVSVCHELLCEKVTRKENGNKIQIITERQGFKSGALEGSSCENGGICIQGNCIQVQRH